MDVYIVLEHYHYDSSEVLAVYATEELAEARKALEEANRHPLAGVSIYVEKETILTS